MSSALKLNQRIARIFSGLGLLAALTMLMLPAHGAAAQGLSGGTVQVHVADLDTGANISGAAVLLVSDQNDWLGKGETDQFGYADLAAPVGSYTIRVTATGYAGVKAYADVKAGTESKVGVTLHSMGSGAPAAGARPPGSTPGMGSMWLAIQDQNTQQPVSDALVAVYDVYGAMAAKGLSGVTGVFAASLPFGTYRVQISASGYKDLKVYVTVSGDPVAPWNVLLQPQVPSPGH